ncbi:unnamed protein product [Pleuronectes platessa]|uniref:Uncharacterized protein n=1 Tax=Pleuronectes platessa TaxID=8262 RepID=A0A9N7UX45_PLEPL|nr:unnamed protein product [Pleuronectes platessa]
MLVCLEFIVELCITPAITVSSDPPQSDSSARGPFSALHPKAGWPVPKSLLRMKISPEPQSIADPLHTPRGPCLSKCRPSLLIKSVRSYFAFTPPLRCRLPRGPPGGLLGFRFPDSFLT